VRWSSIALALAVVVAGLSSQLAITLPALLVAGATWVLSLSTFNVAVQLSAPRWVVARALALYQTAAFGGLAAGSWLWGVVAELHGLSIALSAAGAVLVFCALLGRWIPLAQAEALNLDPLRTWRTPQTAVPVDARTGPVVIAVEFRIREEDTLEFLAAMAERRRIRRRDGARDWKLLRDLADPELWIERYTTPTWLDYIRHNSRLTQDDADIPERIRALHQGPARPVVRRTIERQTGTLPAASRDVHEIDPLTDPMRAS
jgi:hypothetical protein